MNGTLWYYRALTDTYREIGGTPVVAELENTVSAIEAAAAGAEHQRV